MKLTQIAEEPNETNHANGADYDHSNLGIVQNKQQLIGANRALANQTVHRAIRKLKILNVASAASYDPAAEESNVDETDDVLMMPGNVVLINPEDEKFEHSPKEEKQNENSRSKRIQFEIGT